MLEPDILTVVAPLIPGKEEETRAYIRSQIDPGWLSLSDRKKIPLEDANDEDLGTRMADLDFKALPGLHCCAMIVIDGETKPGFFCGKVELPPYLILEATIDGSSETFVRDLVDCSTAQLAQIFRHAEGFPANAEAQPDLLVDFLLRKRVGHHAYFSGVPGKSVSEIESEDELHDFLTRTQKDIFFPDDPGDTAVERPRARFQDLQRRYRNLVRKQPSLNLTEEPSVAPRSIRYGGLVLAMTGIVATLIFVSLACLVLDWLCISYDRIDAFMQARLADSLPDQAMILSGLLIGWCALRYVRTYFVPKALPRIDRGPIYLIDEFLRLGLFAMKMGITAYGLAIALGYVTEGNWLSRLPALQEIIVWAIILLVGLILLFSVKQLRAGPLRALENAAYVLPDSHYIRATNAAIVDTANLAHLIWYLVLLVVGVVLIDPVLGLFLSDWATQAMGLLQIGTVVVLYLLAALLLLLIAKDVFMALGSLLQWREDIWHFGPAEKLAEHNMGREHIWAREEHRTHTDQNHFASATLVKSWPRMLYLRIALALVNFTARYWDNQGKLGGIPTIFSARWVLLDRGHRLVFLTNYVGAWDSYLGEFSDLNAYIGVNAIWTNTYLPLTPEEREKLGTDRRGIGFPTSRFILFGGAALEQPFKAYVRQSQVETLAWYGAYPGLSVPNIHDNARLRKDLFRDLNTAELSAFFQRI